MTYVDNALVRRHTYMMGLEAFRDSLQGVCFHRASFIFGLRYTGWPRTWARQKTSRTFARGTLCSCDARHTCKSRLQQQTREPHVAKPRLQMARSPLICCRIAPNGTRFDVIRIARHDRLFLKRARALGQYPSWQMYYLLYCSRLRSSDYTSTSTHPSTNRARRCLTSVIGFQRGSSLIIDDDVTVGGFQTDCSKDAPGTESRFEWCTELCDRW
jgi:hypothetical protein